MELTETSQPKNVKRSKSVCLLQVRIVLPPSTAVKKGQHVKSYLGEHNQVLSETNLERQIHFSKQSNGYPACIVIHFSIKRVPCMHACMHALACIMHGKFGLQWLRMETWEFRYHQQPFEWRSPLKLTFRKYPAIHTN